MAKKEFTLQDLRKARLNFRARQEFARSAPSMEADARTKMSLRLLARKTMPLVRQKGMKLNMQQWYDRLLNIFKTRNMKVRQALMKELEQYAKDGQ
jgi:hypothetical protein